MNRPVELAITAAVQSVTLRIPAAGRDRGCAGVASELRLRGEALRAGGVTNDDRRGHGPAAVLGEQLRAARLDQRVELGEQV